jgi:uroporphyrinogen decarboxylase
MSKTMSSKERVNLALLHQKPDRIPTALWGSYYTLNDDLYFSFLKKYKIGEPLEPFRKKKPRNSNFYDDRILDFLDTDIRYIWSGFTDLGGARMDTDRKDAWGVQWVRSGPHITSVNPPLKDLTIEQIEAYPWPKPERFFDFELMKERKTYLQRHYSDKAIVARAVNSYGPFEQASEMRGREDFYMDMIMEPQLTDLILKKCTDVIVEAQEIYLDIVGDMLDFFEIPGDDYGGTESLLISPDSFKSQIAPYLEKIVRVSKSYRSSLPVAFHSDGAISSIIGDLIDCGIDILNPLEPLKATDWKAIKAEYGDRLSFMGGVDLKQALTGSTEDVKLDVKRCIDTFAEHGGYILTSANHMQSDVPPANVVNMFRFAKEFGIY